MRLQLITRHILFYRLTILYQLLFKGSRDCKKYSAIKNEDKRSKDYLIDIASDQVISDEYLDAVWYRPLSANGDKMPTSPPGKLHCGTIHPIWLNGSYHTSFKIFTLIL